MSAAQADEVASQIVGCGSGLLLGMYDTYLSGAAGPKRASGETGVGRTTAVLLRVLAHGLTALPGMAAYERKEATLDPDAPELKI